jgi:hypothetical protein
MGRLSQSTSIQPSKQEINKINMQWREGFVGDSQRIRNRKLRCPREYLLDVPGPLIHVVDTQHICNEECVEVAVEDLCELEPVGYFFVAVRLVAGVPPKAYRVYC